MTHNFSSLPQLMIASWSSGSEATIFGGIEINVTETQKYIQKVREATGEKVTITHVTILAIAKAMEACPSMNGRLIFEYFFPHKSVDIGCLVALDDGKDLANVKITDCNTKSLVEIAQALAPAAKKLREGKDEDFKKVSSTLRAIPSFVMPFLATFTGFLAGAIGLDIPAMGVKPFPFGSAMVTSIGMLGLEGACVPFTPFARVPALCCVGKISDKAVVEDGKVVVRPMVSISGTLDHR